MASELLERVELEPEGAARAVVLWLHGLGADGHDFEPVVPELGVPKELGIRFVFPHAPYRPITLNGGLIMRGWYDIRDLSITQNEDEEGLRQSQELLRALVDHEVRRGTPAGRIVLAGFSQGGAIALQAGLRHPERLAGILALSTYITLPATLEAERTEANADVPVFMAHGLYDPLIPLEAARGSKDRLLELGYGVEWREYPMAHAVSGEEIADISRWLREVLEHPHQPVTPPEA